MAPDDEFALRTALAALGGYDLETVRILWIRNTEELGELRASAAIVADLPASATVVGQEVLTFEDGEARFADA